MSSQANWSVVTVAEDSGRSADAPLFFDRDQWVVMEAATARIIPTDHDPGAREAGAVRFIDTATWPATSTPPRTARAF